LAEVGFLYVTLDGREGRERPLFESKCLEALSDRRMSLSIQDQARQRDDKLLKEDKMYQKHLIQNVLVEIPQSGKWAPP
jgi:hypothetical protein